MGENVNKITTALHNIRCLVTSIDQNKCYDDVNKLIDLNIIRNRLLSYALAVRDNMMLYNRKLKEYELISEEIREIVDNINEKIEMLKD